MQNILSVEVLQDVSVSDNFNLADYAKESFGAWHEDPVDVEWLFSPRVAEEAKQLLLHFIFEKLELKEGVISYKLKSPFCYTKIDSSMSSMSPVPAKNNKNWELIENTGLNGDFGENSGNLDEDVWEPCGSVKNKGLSTCRENPIQYGCFTWTRTKIDGVRIRCPTIRR